MSHLAVKDDCTAHSNGRILRVCGGVPVCMVALVVLFFRALEGRIHDGDDLNVDSCVDVVDDDDGTMMVMVMVMMM